MSNQTNTNIAEAIAERLEALKGVLNSFDYQDRQDTLIQYFADGEYQEAEEFITMLEERHAGDVADANEDELVYNNKHIANFLTGEELEGEDTDIY